MADVAEIVRSRIAGDLVPAVADYFVDVGVVAVAAQGNPRIRASLPELHEALASFARSRQCPPILRYIIPGPRGELFAATPPHRMWDRVEIHDRLEAEHPQHLISLAGFGDKAEAVCRSIEMCVLCLFPDPADYSIPSPIAAALRTSAALDECLGQLAEQSASMSDTEKLSAFRDRLAVLRWKHTFCKEGSRPPSAPPPPHRPLRLPSAGQVAAECDVSPPPPDPAEEEQLAWEREGGKQWNNAHAVPWRDVVVPMVQSCRDVGALAQKYAAGEELIALTLTACRELWGHAITAPNEAAMMALQHIEAGIDLLWVRLAAPTKLAGATGPTLSPQPTKGMDDSQPMERIRLRVLQADGKYRGSFFYDRTSNPNRWIGAAQPGVQEVMVCDGPMESGSWFLIEYARPSQISGDIEHDSLFDEASRCCCRTPAQALYWFTQQAIGLPTALVKRVRNYAARWRTFCSSSSARALLQRLLKSFVSGDHEMFAGQGSSDFMLLRDLDLIVEASGSPPSYVAESIVIDMGIDGYIAWMNGHLTRVADSLGGADHPTSATAIDGNVKPLPKKKEGSLKFTPSSEAAVTAIVRAVADLRKSAPDIIPKKERIKSKASKTGGAGDRAVERAIDLGLITPDHLVTELGRLFLAERS